MKLKSMYEFNIKKEHTSPLTINIHKNKNSKITSKQMLRLITLINSAVPPHYIFNLPKGKILEDIKELKITVIKKDGSGKIKVKFKK